MSNIFNSVYGPVNSWRYGKSLGVDVICGESTCSFNCIYCQLGNIINVTSERKNFITTEKFISDFEKVNYSDADIITFSGSGEPTLALNISDIINEIKIRTNKPILVLTNSTLLHDDSVIKDLKNVQKVSAKLDSYDQKSLNMMNRPDKYVKFETIIQGIKKFRNQFSGKLSIQYMIMPANKKNINEVIEIIKDLNPDEIELNTPTRPYPLEWEINNRGHVLENVKKIKLHTITIEEIKDIIQLIKRESNIPVISPHNL